MRVLSDFVLDPNDEEELDRLSQVLRDYERAGRFAAVPLIRLAQALIHAADPFIFLRTPAPYELATTWPTEQKLDTTFGSPVSSFANGPWDDDGSSSPTQAEPEGASREFLYGQLRDLLEADLPPSTRLLAGTVRAFSSNWDVEVSIAHVIKLERPQPDDTRPCLLNARSSLLYEDLDALIVAGNGGKNIWLSQQVGGLFLFSGEHLDAFPTQTWRTRLGWHPSQGHPLVWERSGERVAWFERFVGPIRQIYPRDRPDRQPMLSRWVCLASEWTRLVKELGEPDRVVAGDFAASGVYGGR